MTPSDIEHRLHLDDCRPVHAHASDGGSFDVRGAPLVCVDTHRVTGIGPIDGYSAPGTLADSPNGNCSPRTSP